MHYLSLALSALLLGVAVGEGGEMPIVICYLSFVLDDTAVLCTSVIKNKQQVAGRRSAAGSENVPRARATIHVVHTAIHHRHIVGMCIDIL